MPFILDKSNHGENDTRATALLELANCNLPPNWNRLATLAFGDSMTTTALRYIVGAIILNPEPRIDHFYVNQIIDPFGNDMLRQHLDGCGGISSNAEQKCPVKILADGESRTIYLVKDCANTDHATILVWIKQGNAGDPSFLAYVPGRSSKP